MKVDPTQLNWKDFNMENIQRIFATIGDNWFFKVILGSLLSLNDWVFHPKHDTVTIVMAFIALDTLTGLMKAFKNGTVSSSGFFRCAVKIVVYFSLLATGALLDRVTSMDAIISALSVMATFLSTTEAISVLENAAGLGFKIPTQVIKMLKFAQGEALDGNDKTKRS